jgi:hypothetical protein
MDQRPWKANSSWASQEIPSILCNPQVHFRVHSSLPLIPILSHIMPVHDLPSYLRSILKLFSHLYLGLPSGSYLQVSPPEPCAAPWATARSNGGFHSQSVLWEETVWGLNPEKLWSKPVNGGHCGRWQCPVFKHTLALDTRLRKIRVNLRRVAF